jgi:hypothetical protein
MDPKKQDCHGLYLYGSGYFAREDETLRQLNKKGYSFCEECPHRSSCYDRHCERTRELLPAAVESFDAQRRIAERRGMGVHLFSALKMKHGDPDPFMRLAIENYKAGVAARSGER